MKDDQEAEEEDRSEEAAREAGCMSQRQFKTGLNHLGLTVAGKATAKAFGLGIRQCARMANGKVPVSGPVGQLMKMYLMYGIPDAEA